MEPESSLPHSHEPVPIPKQTDRVHAPTNQFFNIYILMLSSHLSQSLPSGLLPTGLPTKSLYAFLYSPICITCPVDPSLPDLVTRITVGEKYGASSFSLCSLLHSRITSSPLGPNILLSTLFLKPSGRVSPSMWATMFYNHIKQPERL